MPRIPPLEDSIVRGIAEELGATQSGLSNREIDDLLRVAGLRDVSPKAASPYTFIAVSKRDRLYSCLTTRQAEEGSANGILHFIECVMHPVRFTQNRRGFEIWRTALNERLAFAGLQVTQAGRIARRAEKATTLSQARVRSQHLRKLLVERGTHPRVLLACGTEIDDDNYFHTVLEAAKSLAAEIRGRTGLTADGAELIDQAFERGHRRYPLLACNSLETDTEWSEQRGVANLLRGVMGAFRNPAAHEPKMSWRLAEEDALDALSLISFLHRKLDSVVVTPDVT